MKVSWLILTYNRAEKVQRSVTHNLAHCGERPDEIVWVDNGSTDGVREFMKSLNPDVSVLHNRNMGVAKGYNRDMVLATGDYLVITGCDMLMPSNWLATFKDYFRKIPETGIACMYSGHLSDLPERARKGLGHGDWKSETRNGLNFVHAMPMGRRMWSRELMHKIGYLREDFGLYGHEDLEWAHRAESVCDSLGLLYYVIPDVVVEHLGTEAVVPYDGKDEREYHAFKQREAGDPAKELKMSECRKAGWPYFSPYVGGRRD